MSMALDVSQGVDPVPVYYDSVTDDYHAWVDGRSVRFRELPFTLTSIRGHGYDVQCADKSLILKHARKTVDPF